jgi:hypothetical protein
MVKMEIKCLKCGSINIKKFETSDDFLARKDEGESARKQVLQTKQEYLCLEHDCGYKWEEDL